MDTDNKSFSNEIDLLYEQAVAYVRKYRNGTCSGLQGHLHIGYSLAMRLKERMTNSGIYAGIEVQPEPASWNIKAFGVGGAGCNALSVLTGDPAGAVEAIAVNMCGAAALRRTTARIVGLTDCPDSDNNTEKLQSALQGADLVFVAVGLGGATGSATAPLIAQIARTQGALCIAVACIPFAYESEQRRRTADASLLALSQRADAVFVSPLDPGDSGEDDGSMSALLHARDSMLHKVVHALAPVFAGKDVWRPSRFEIQGLLRQPGFAALGRGSASGPERTQHATQQAYAELVRQGVNAHSVKGLLVVIKVDRNSRYIKLASIMAVAQVLMAPDAKIQMSTVLLDDVGDAVHVVLVATGVQFNARPIHGALL